MGIPELRGLFIPVNIDKEIIINEPITVSNGKKYNMTCVSMGNPHAVIFVDEITDELIFTDGRLLEVHEMFPRKINVHFVKIISPTEVSMRVWERGSGETLACGTGASAVTVAAILNKLTASKITVHLLGGDLEMEWAENKHVYMTGPATTVFAGSIKI
jgi:diaminopimelate epimerase